MNCMNIPIKNRILIVGDFNLDLLLDMKVQKISEQINLFHLHQQLQYVTHVQGRILHLVLDNENLKPISWIPSPYSDYFIILIYL